MEWLLGHHGLIWFMQTGGWTAWAMCIAVIVAFVWVCSLPYQQRRDMEEFRMLRDIEALKERKR